MPKDKNKSFRPCNQQSCSDSVEFSDPLDETKSVIEEEKKKKQKKNKKKNK